MTRRKSQIKVHFPGIEMPLFERHHHTIKDLKTGKRKPYSSVNAAKRFARKVIDEHGLNSVTVVKT